MCALRTVQYLASSSSNFMLESPRWNPAGVATRSRRLWRVQFDDLGRASIHLTSQRPKRRHEPCALRAPRDWESIKFLTSWPICKLPASQSRTDFNLRPTISAASKDLASISSIPGPATNEASWATCFAAGTPLPSATSVAQSAWKGYLDLGTNPHEVARNGPYVLGTGGWIRTTDPPDPQSVLRRWASSGRRSLKRAAVDTNQPGGFA